MKKVLSLVLTTAICMTSLNFAPIKSEAATVMNSNIALVQESNSGNWNVETYTLDANTLQNGGLISQKNVVTKAVKFLIKNIIKHGKTVAKVIEKVSGKKVAKQFLKYHAGIAAELTPLLEWSDIPKQAVADAVYKGVINFGGSEAIAKNISLAIKEAWDWLIF